MGTLVADRVERPLSLFDDIEGREAAAREAAGRSSEARTVTSGTRPRGGVGGESTLDELIVAAWEGLTAQAAAACPVCGGALRPRYADAGGMSPPVSASCTECGSTLS